MLILEYILILLTAVFLSNLINRFIPSISVPIVQIILGTCISFLPLKLNIELDPSLFFLLFIAPLIFNTSMLLDKKSFWSMKWPIMNMSIILVLLTVIGVGYFVNVLIPAIPISAAFILVASLGPTDDIAILSISKRISIPKKLMNILTGESIINDASGIICFQFALAAVISGYFSPVKAVGQLFTFGIIGLCIGVLFTVIKYLFVKWIRYLGIENITLHILIEILTPFFVYLLAEVIGVSGVLAVFAAGITHSLNKEKLNPDTSNLNIASKNIWEVFSFSLEGIVYLILGMQLPNILKTIHTNTYDVTITELIFYIIIITFVFVISRFIWFYLTTKKRNYSDNKNHTSKLKACLIFSLSGARGAVTMASTLSIPTLLSDGTAFPYRDLIILLSTGVILCSLFISNFVLPTVIGKSTKKNEEQDENNARIEILNNVIEAIRNLITEENKVIAGMIIKQYKDRIRNLENKSLVPSDKNKEKNIRIKILEWEKQNINILLTNNEIDESYAAQYLISLERSISRVTRKKYNFFKLFIVNYLSYFIDIIRYRKNTKISRNDLLKLKEINSLFVIQKLKELQKNNDSYELKKIHYEYEYSLLIIQSMLGNNNRKRNARYNKKNMLEIASLSLQIERDNIQIMFENSRISREKAKELRNNITLLENEFIELDPIL